MIHFHAMQHIRQQGYSSSFDLVQVFWHRPMSYAVPSGLVSVFFTVLFEGVLIVIWCQGGPTHCYLGNPIVLHMENMVSQLESSIYDNFFEVYISQSFRGHPHWQCDWNIGSLRFSSDTSAGRRQSFCWYLLMSSLNNVNSYQDQDRGKQMELNLQLYGWRGPELFHLQEDSYCLPNAALNIHLYISIPSDHTTQISEPLHFLWLLLSNSLCLNHVAHVHDFLGTHPEASFIYLFIQNSRGMFIFLKQGNYHQQNPDHQENFGRSSGCLSQCMLQFATWHTQVPQGTGIGSQAQPCLTLVVILKKFVWPFSILTQ